MAPGEIALNAIFYLFALLAVGGALMVAVSKNIVRTAFSLLAVLFAAAAMYGIAKMDFIMAVQVLVYVGGILVLIIFAVMLTHRITDVTLSNESAPGPVAFFATLCLLAAILMVVLGHSWGVKPAESWGPNINMGKGVSLTEATGRKLMGEYLLPFEIISVLLLAALVGAAYLARKEVKEK